MGRKYSNLFLMLIVFASVAFILIATSNARAHSGRTDSSGGHNCNVGSCAGTYHYHNGGGSYTPPPEPEYEPPQEPEYEPPEEPVYEPEPEESFSETSSSEESTSSDSDCFIATAAYGTPVASDIDVLREFRDKTLMNNAAGKVFVNNYYKHGPRVANVVAGNSVLRWYIRELQIKPVVTFLELTGSIRD